ncbi:hypothetical protein [Sphingomonas sp. CLY1604]|uniref:hypothetical protein n=1 Tax=Sphingomonas sp. CLY1604 TaxID=3457786 RepID=UPI003FD6CBAF
MIVFLIAGLLATAAQTAPAPAPTDAAPKPEKRVCRSETATGSTIPKRICHTKAEWAQIESDNARNVDAVRNRAPSR